ncbi:unnamed protein product [Dovyalis caffra]|uniref:Uncharacterized protein n=1 Tax=Dovyalis caffra TaxID=77055 RepID=A0AAV1SNJ9_9ROSI|nr:unnamed protein product [Dovyalis caffra]
MIVTIQLVAGMITLSSVLKEQHRKNPRPQRSNIGLISYAVADALMLLGDHQQRKALPFLNMRFDLTLSSLCLQSGLDIRNLGAVGSDNELFPLAALNCNSFYRIKLLMITIAIGLQTRYHNKEDNAT